MRHRERRHAARLRSDDGTPVALGADMNSALLLTGCAALLLACDSRVINGDQDLFFDDEDGSSSGGGDDGGYGGSYGHGPATSVSSSASGYTSGSGGTVIHEGEQAFVAIGAGWYHACGIGIDGALTCWGDDDSGQASPPAGAFLQVAGGTWSTCGLRADRTVICWGDPDQSASPHSTFDAIGVAYDGGGCGIEGDEIRCWNHGVETAVPGSYTSLSVGGFHACALRTDGTAHCWGGNAWGQSSPPAGTFVRVAAGNLHTCGLRPGGEIECWGYDAQGQLSPPNGPFTDVYGGADASCGLRVDGSLACWGWDTVTGPPSGAFATMSFGNFHACGLRPGGTVACWGENDRGQSSPP